MKNMLFIYDTNYKSMYARTACTVAKEVEAYVKSVSFLPDIICH